MESHAQPIVMSIGQCFAVWLIKLSASLARVQAASLELDDESFRQQVEMITSKAQTGLTIAIIVSKADVSVSQSAICSALHGDCKHACHGLGFLFHALLCLHWGTSWLPSGVAQQVN
jgi:hypothetical protein